MQRLQHLSIGLTLSLIAASITAAANEPTIEVEALERRLEQSPIAQAARADVAVIEEEKLQRSTRNGWELFGGLNAAALNEIEGDDNRRYDRVQGDIGLRHPLLGSQRAETDAVTDLERLRLRTKGEADARVAQLRIELRRRYADYWLHNRLLKLGEDWLQSSTAALDRVSAQAGATILNSDIAALETAVEQARIDVAQANAARQASRRAIESILGESVAAFEPRWPANSAICQVETDLRNALWEQDPTIRATKAELALVIEQGGYALVDEVDSNLTLTHSQILEEWDDRGHETSIGLSAAMPIAVGKAHGQREAWRNAQILQLQRRLEVDRQAVVAQVAETLAQMQLGAASRDAAEARLRQAHYMWLEARERSGILSGDNALQPLQRSVAWYQAARERLQREYTWLAARAELEGIETPDCQPSLATPPSDQWLKPLALEASSTETMQ